MKVHDFYKNSHLTSHLPTDRAPERAKDRRVTEDSLELKALGIQLISTPVCSGDSRTGTYSGLPGVGVPSTPLSRLSLPTLDTEREITFRKGLRFFNPTQYGRASREDPPG